MLLPTDMPLEEDPSAGQRRAQSSRMWPRWRTRIDDAVIGRGGQSERVQGGHCQQASVDRISFPRMPTGRTLRPFAPDCLADLLDARLWRKVKELALTSDEEDVEADAVGRRHSPRL